MLQIPVQDQTPSAAVLAFAGSLRDRFPFLDMLPIGKSAGGSDIPGLMLGSGTRHILFASGFFEETQTSAVLTLKLCEAMCRSVAENTVLSDMNFRAALLDRSIFFVPLACPDDAKRFSGRADDPSFAALSALCERAAFHHILTLRAGEERITWDFGAHTPQEAPLVAGIFEAFSGFPRTPPADTPETVFLRHFVETYDRAGFSLSLGGDQPLSEEALSALYQKAEETLVLGAIM